MDYAAAWALAEKVFPVLNKEIETHEIEGKGTKRELNQLIEIANKMGLGKKIHDHIFNKIRERFRSDVAPQFWFILTRRTDEIFRQVYTAINELYDSYKRLERVMKKLDLFKVGTNVSGKIWNEENSRDMLQLLCKGTLLLHLNLKYHSRLLIFYEHALKLEDIDEIGTDCINCTGTYTECKCRDIFQETNRKLGELGLLEPLCGQIITNLIYEYIYTDIQKTCKDNYDASFIESLERWLQNVVISWLQSIYRYETSTPLEKSLEVFKVKLTNYLYNTYTKIRIDQLFDIIIEYPESLPALEDLKICLPRTDLKPYLIKRLQKAMETRLLHPGVSTPDVLTAYVSAIRSLKVLDPTGLLLQTVTQPVHQYLRSREDTVRCVVTSLTEEGPNDLAEELVRGEAVVVDENAPVSDDGGENWETWMPDPIDAVPSKSSNVRRTSDIISMLVNVYGSTELFVNEYRTLLADRLLSQHSCDTEKEIRYLELLKLRFGDSQLHYCEVMLKDIADSKRINQNIKQDPDYSEGQTPLSAMIVSSQFWPPFKEEKLKVHKTLEEQMEAYTSAFEKLKGSRTLCWKHHLGMVDLEVELPDRTLTLSVSPAHATIIMHFQDKNIWELEELSKVMQCPATLLRKKMSFWQSHGVIVETQTDTFQIQDGAGTSSQNIQEDIFVEDFESESAMASAQDQREEELQTFWSYIVGMLMNLETLPIERIHQMLKMFAFQGPTLECSMQELKVFLDRKVREHQLICSGGFYSLPK